MVSVTAVVILGIFGVALWIMDDYQYLSLAALFVALLALLYQYRQSKRYWMHSLIIDPTDPVPDPGNNP